MSERPWRPVFTVPCAELALGARRFDIRHRALVAGTIDLPREAGPALTAAERLVADGADLLHLEVSAAGGDGRDALLSVVSALHQQLDVPLCVAASAREVPDLLAVGAALVEDRSPSGDPATLQAVAAAGASLLVTDAGAAAPADPDSEHAEAIADRLAARAREAAAAGIPPARIVLDAGLAGRPQASALCVLHHHDRLAALGWPLAVSAPVAPVATPADADDAHTAAHAAHALALTLGARVLRASDVRGARRTADVVAAILEARRP